MANCNQYPILHAQPNVIEVSGRFGRIYGVESHAYIDGIQEGFTNLNTIYRAVAQWDYLDSSRNAPTFLTITADAVLTASTLDLAAYGCAVADSVISAAAAGVAGDAIQFCMFPGAAEAVSEDLVNNIVYVSFIVGASTMATVQATINGGATLVTCGAPPVGGVLGAGDEVAPTFLAGGEDREWASTLTAPDGITRDMFLHFQDGITTVGQLETMVTGIGSFIEVGENGTGASILAVGVDEMPRTLLRAPMPTFMEGKGWTAVRMGVGIYLIAPDVRLGIRSIISVQTSLAATAAVNRYTISSVITGGLFGVYVTDTAGNVVDLNPANNEEIHFQLAGIR